MATWTPLVNRDPTKNSKKMDNLEMTLEPQCHEEINEQNPFLIHVVLDLLFKKLPFDELKKFRLVSSTWNQVGYTELCKRPRKTIKFKNKKELEPESKLGGLVQLKRRHNEIFLDREQQLFTSFSIDITILRKSQIGKFFENFSPKYFELDGHSVLFNEGIEDLCKFLVKISPTVVEIKYNFYNFIDCTKLRKEDVEHLTYFDSLTSTLFPNLKKISHSVCYGDSRLKKLFFYSLIGQNSPKLRHLELGDINKKSFGSPGFMREQFEVSGLMSKLQILELEFDVENKFNKDLINVFTQFGQNGELKLTKLKINQNMLGTQQPRRLEFQKIFVPLIETQAANLKILEICTPPPAAFICQHHSQPQPPIPFPSLENLTSLKINYFNTFKNNLEPINFSLQFPKLVQFTTTHIKIFLAQNLGHSGDSVKSLILKPSMKMMRLNYFERYRLNFDQLYQIFPNLEFLELDLFHLYPSGPFSSQLKRVVIRCELEDLFVIDRKLLQNVKNVELVVDCGEKLTDGFFKIYLGDFMKLEQSSNDKISLSAYYNSGKNKYKYKYYQQFLDRIVKNFTSLPSVSFKFIGYKISEDFKRDFKAIHPISAFISSDDAN